MFGLHCFLLTCFYNADENYDSNLLVCWLAWIAANAPVSYTGQPPLQSGSSSLSQQRDDSKNLKPYNFNQIYSLKQNQVANSSLHQPQYQPTQVSTPNDYSTSASSQQAYAAVPHTHVATSEPYVPAYGPTNGMPDNAHGLRTSPARKVVPPTQGGFSPSAHYVGMPLQQWWHWPG